MDVQSLSIGAEDSLWGMIAGAGFVVKFVLVILLFFSVMSWAIIIYKYITIRRMEKESASFLEFFWHKKQFAPVFEACRGYRFTPLAKLFTSGYNELMQSKIHKKEGQGDIHIGTGELDNVQRALKKTISAEVARLEKAVTFLATTGNTTPFIGLFGTVWGIMNSFRGIGLKGSASLAVVAPGISEALVATAMGLVAAIPAVVAYNHFVTRINRLAMEMENFSADFLNIVERWLAREKR